MKTPLILTITGISGSGKTTAARILSEKYGFENIVSYTTRPIRDGEVDGIDHYFVTDEEMPSKVNMLAYVNFGGYHYWTLKSQLSSAEKPYVYVIDEKGLDNLYDTRDEMSNDEYFIIRTLYIRGCHVKGDDNRLSRDTGRIHHEDNFYNHIVDNDGSLEDFENKIAITAHAVIADWSWRDGFFG